MNGGFPRLHAGTRPFTSVKLASFLCRMEANVKPALQPAALGLSSRFCVFLFKSFSCKCSLACLHSSCSMANHPVELWGKLLTKPWGWPSAALCTYLMPPERGLCQAWNYCRAAILRWGIGSDKNKRRSHWKTQISWTFMSTHCKPHPVLRYMAHWHALVLWCCDVARSTSLVVGRRKKG